MKSFFLIFSLLFTSFSVEATEPDHSEAIAETLNPRDALDKIAVREMFLTVLLFERAMHLLQPLYPNLASYSDFRFYNLIYSPISDLFEQSGFRPQLHTSITRAQIRQLSDATRYDETWNLLIGALPSFRAQLAEQLHSFPQMTPSDIRRLAKFFAEIIILLRQDPSCWQNMNDGVRRALMHQILLILNAIRESNEPELHIVSYAPTLPQINVAQQEEENMRNSQPLTYDICLAGVGLLALRQEALNTRASR